MDLATFNQLSPAAAQAAVAHCVAITQWQQALVAKRPYASVQALLSAAEQLATRWQLAELNQALAAHPRIGERASGEHKEAALSRGEQSSMQQANPALQQAMQMANQHYEQRFGRVFLIRASGRSGEEMLAEITRRSGNSPSQEEQEALGQLREITLLRLRETLQ